MKTLNVLTLVVLVVGVSAVRADAVTIDPGAYAGRYYINGVGGPYFGSQTIALGQGTYFLDLGAEIGGSGFTFDVDAGGNAGNVTPAVSASAVGSTITFNTTPIAIDAGAYAGRYFLSIFGTAVEYHGNVAGIVVVPGLTYTLDDGAEGVTTQGSSGFIFSVDALGNVATSSPAASASGPTLSLNTVPVQINPGAFSAPFYLSSFFPTPFVGPQTLMLMPSLIYTLDDGAEISGSAFAFLVDAAGNVSTASGAASGAGSTLALANVVIHVDDPTGTPYSITGYPNLTSSIDLVLIPTLQAFVFTPTGSAAFVPTASGFTASVGGLTLTSGSPYAAAIQTPIKSDGTSVFKANRGVVPVKFTLTLNGAATCQLPAATISLTRTSGASAGVVNQSDYLMPSDGGSTFRIDSCQYVYNLGTSTLGAGQYRVDISINGVVVGNGRFGLN